ncbi:Pseudouridine-5'-phosphatase [Clonorchis sinensis]|uniref:Pseudouridine-5'-phosphatase n=2 Tax=Clonorchis sinensis TaxID=79923 RepID=A0A8T1MMS1_CLOSI|nr:Pseudouridine-5'-phosphatase [Clonorchis sinensis]GAA50813.1 pseudouridine-5'-monophosphatase [Clonorchis sinensis]
MQDARVSSSRRPIAWTSGLSIIFALIYMRPCISHVIFDVDGLLLDTESVYSAISTEILDEYGLKLTYDTKRKIMGRKPLEAASVLVHELSAPFTAFEWMSMFKTRLSLDKWHLVSPLPGAEKLVLHLAKHNVPIAVATGCRSDELRHKMKNHQTLWQHVSVAVASGDDPMIRHGKPQPDIFLAAASRFTNQPANSDAVLVFEDSPLGVEAAILAGMHVIWVPAPEEPPSVIPETIHPSAANRVTRLSSLLEFKPENFGLPRMQE